MDLPPLLIQTAGSLVAILMLAGLAWWLRLGGAPQLDNDEAVRRAANEVEFGFDPITIARDAQGRAALARDASGRIMVIKRHGNRWAGRVLGPATHARSDGEQLAVDCSEALFGKVLLALPDPEAWADAINALSGQDDA